MVGEAIRRLRPRYVLVEGPSDMNERLGELLLPHDLPVALFTYRQDESGAHRGMWSPFCDYSPEWVALRAAVEVGATPLFVDLPAWHDVFDGEENRYSDRHVRHSDRLGELCARLGFEDTDALWDHLFEQPQDEQLLAARLSSYFEQLRGDEPGGHRDGPREDFMAQFIAWAMAQSEGADVVMVCGGYHKPALERLWQSAPRSRPTLREPEKTRLGSYLVPFSYRRLDSFAGYASGMPSPAFYQRVWEEGPAKAADAMLFAAIRHLRGKQQRVSPADAIAASTLAHGLKALRGHEALSRIDLLDGLAGALVKDALEAPLPWTRRGTLSARTEPLLAELVRAFSGHKVGVLAPGTPQPPLLHDAFAEVERVHIALTREPQRVVVPLTTEAGAAQSAVLHRLRVLEIPGFAQTRAPSLSRAKTELSEEWSVQRGLDTDPALVEAALYGATLVGAAAAKIEERSRDAEDVLSLANTLFDAALCGIAHLTARALGDLARVVASEPSFTALGGALGKLLALRRGEAVLGKRGHMDLASVLAACFDRGLWLFEATQGASAPLDEGHVRAVVALRDTLRVGPPELDVDPARARGLCERRTKDPEAPPALRGAALGLLWSMLDENDDAEARQKEAIAVLRAVARPETFGDFLGGLFALAREEVVRAEGLVGTIDACVTGFLRDDFLIALPALRQAFAYFPPRERLRIAETILELGAPADGPKAAARVDPMVLLRAPIDVSVVERGHRLEQAAATLAARFGLDDGGSSPVAPETRAS